jgi:hypothetical protein
MSTADRNHAQYRDLISARLDDSLAPAEEARLIEHLVRCGRCRATERAYRAQRQQLRTAPQRPVLPPRDMWARTSAALDREVARTGGHLSVRGQLGHLLAGGAAVASVATIGLSLGLITNQMPSAVTPPATPGTADVVRPTPFTVPAEALAFLGSGAEGLTVYRTRVDRVCPAAAIDCVDYRASAPAIVRLPRTLQPSNLALSPNGGRLAIQGRELGGEDVIAVVVMPDDELARQPGRSGPGSAATPGAEPMPTTRPSFSPMTEGPSATASASASGAPTATVTPSARETPAASSAPLSASPSPDGTDASAAPDPGRASPLASELPAEAMLAILDEVRSVGAPAAWSGDGSALAFSAMPADLSRGPDVYIWRPGDERAQPLTTDHGSYFASWAGTRIVVSRVVPVAPGATEGTEPVVTTVVIDPLTGEERTTDAGAGLWLPAVNSLGTKLVAWHGSLGWAGNEVEPRAGALYVADWAEVDPFSAPAGQQTPPPDSSVAPAGGEEEGTNDEEAVAPEDPESVEPADDEEPAAESPAAEPVASEAPNGAKHELRAADAEAGHEPVDEPVEDRSPEDAPALRLVPVEAGRDPTDQPVQDWQTRWSPDGNVLAVWVADVPGASWGQLTVMALDPSTGTLDDDQPFLATSLARRAFTLGSNRVAWVAPADGEPQGELRIRTWGPDGFGDLRLRPQPLHEVVPAS